MNVMSFSHLGLSQLPLGAGAVIEVQQVDAAALGLIRYQRTPHQDLVSENEMEKGQGEDPGAVVGHGIKQLFVSCVADTNLEQKSWKGLRMGKPVRRILTVSNMPEYLSWFSTTVWSKWSGILEGNISCR